MIVGVTSNNRKIPRWFWPGKFWGEERLKLPQGTVASQIIVVWNNNKTFKFWGRSKWSTLGWEAGGREGHAKFTPIPSPAPPVPLGRGKISPWALKVCGGAWLRSGLRCSSSVSPPPLPPPLPLPLPSLSFHPSAFSFFLSCGGQVSKRPGPKDANA